MPFCEEVGGSLRSGVCWQGVDNHWPLWCVALAAMVQILFKVF